MENPDKVDIEQIEWNFGKAAPKIVREYLGPLGFDMNYQSPRVCEMENRHCVANISIERTKIRIVLTPKPDSGDEMHVDCSPVDVQNRLEMEEELRRQLEHAIANYRQILCGEVER